MIYLFLGDQTPAKDRKISEIKNKTLPSLEAEKFDYEILYGEKLNPDQFKQALIALPAVAAKRLIILRAVDKLTAHNQTILLEFIESKPSHCILILDSNDPGKKNKFFKTLQALARLVDFGTAQKKNVFDMTRAMSARRPADALRILSDILEEGAHPLQIMGGLVWFWGKSRNRLSPERFKSGLMQLQEADLNIKRSRLQPEYALEELVLKLSSLIAS